MVSPVESEFLALLGADILLFVHVMFVACVVGGLMLVLLGGWRGWYWVRNPWFRIIHVAAIGIVVVQSWLGITCPLTVWEMSLRERAGDTTYSGAFIAHWFEAILYYQAPMWVFTAAYSGFAALVVVSWFRVPPRPIGGRRSVERSK